MKNEDRVEIEMQMPLPVALAWYEAWKLFHEVTGRQECHDEFVKALTAMAPRPGTQDGSTVSPSFRVALRFQREGKPVPRWVGLLSMLDDAVARWEKQRRPLDPPSGSL